MNEIDGVMRLERLALARGQLDRVAHRRNDTRWLAQAWADPRTRVLIVEDGHALVRLIAVDDGPRDGGVSGGRSIQSGSSAGPDRSAGAVDNGGREGAGVAELVLVPPEEAPDGDRILLGVDAAGLAYFAVLGPLPGDRRLVGQSQDPAIGWEAVAGRPPGSRKVPRQRPRAGHAGHADTAHVMRAGLRQVGALLGDRDAGLFTHAVALANWHATHGHCPRCGERTRLTAAGHTRLCPHDGSEHFPRVDPAVIMLVLDSADRCVLARNHNWPENRVSILAGFVEPGESVEQAVAREVREEVGLSVGEVRYLGSQPWPMPQSLMLGFSARVVGDQGNQRIRVDDDEIAEARWYSRDDLRAAIEAGEILLPPPVSIAHRIIEAWYGAPLPTRV